MSPVFLRYGYAHWHVYRRTDRYILGTFPTWDEAARYARFIVKAGWVR